MGFARRDYIIVRLGLLKDEPHGYDVVLGPAPVPLAFQTAKRQFLIEPTRDSRRHSRDLASDEVFTAPGRLVVVENSLAIERSIGIAVHPREPRDERLRAAVRARRTQWRHFGLRRFGGVP